MSGEVDLSPMTDPTTLVTLKDNPDVVLDSVKGGTLLTMSMFTETPPFDNLKVRQALKAVVDRQAIVDTVLLGYGEPGNDNPVPPSRPDAFMHEPIPRDVEKAKKLLAEAGYADGLTVDLYTSEHFPGINQLTEAYKEMAAEAGITVNIINTPTDSYWEEIWLKKPFMTSYWAARPSPTALGIAYKSDAPWNETQWHRPDFDALLDKAKQTLDQGERTKIYQEAQRLLAEEGGAIITAFTMQTSALRKECTGYKTHIDNNRMDFRNVVCK
jgi:peptide/nickel transport system substrate-binding protein